MSYVVQENENGGSGVVGMDCRLFQRLSSSEQWFSIPKGQRYRHLGMPFMKYLHVSST